MEIIRWSKLKSDWLYSLQPKWRSSIQSAKTRPGAYCGSDHEFLIAKFRLKLKNVEKTTRPFRYDLNQIPYDYTVEVTNRFKGLDLIQSAWWTMDGTSWHCTGDRNQDHPQKKKCKKAKWLSYILAALQIAVKRKVKSKGEKERNTHMNAEFQRIARRSLSITNSWSIPKPMSI